jgi:multidrug efflux pump subunit AcrA (membrane-fusion protein)
MSLDQGSDFFKYHANQHGGEAPYPQALQGDAIPSSMVGPSMSTGYYRAFQDVAGLKDASPMAPNPPLAGVSAAPANTTVQGGGLRRGKYLTRKQKQQQKKQQQQLKQQQKQQQQQLKQQQKQQQQQLKQQQKQQQQQLKQQGGAVLGYDSVSAPGLLLPTQSMYNQAGLNPQYYLGTSTEQADAIARDQI